MKEFCVWIWVTGEVGGLLKKQQQQQQNKHTKQNKTQRNKNNTQTQQKKKKKKIENRTNRFKMADNEQFEISWHQLSSQKWENHFPEEIFP